MTHDLAGLPLPRAERRGVIEPDGTTDDDDSVDGVSLTVNTDNFADSVVVRLSATDGYGNESVGAIELFIDRGGPVFDYEIPAGSSVGEQTVPCGPMDGAVLPECTLSVSL